MTDRRVISNPFVFRTPVGGAEFFGREDLLQEIFRYLRAGESVSLVGEWRTGKTSILQHIHEQKLRWFEDPRHVFVLMDFLGRGYQTDLAVWIALLESLAEEMDAALLASDIVQQAIARLREEQSRGGQRVSDTVLDLLRSLQHEKIKVTLMFDEFGSTAQGQEPIATRLYPLLRSLAVDPHTELTYTIATRQRLGDIERSLRQRFSTRSSPLFNILHEVFVPPFSPEQAAEMISRLMQTAEVDTDTTTAFLSHIDTLFRLSGFHPFFLQMACYQLFKSCVLADGSFSGPVPEDEIRVDMLAEAVSYFEDYWEHSSADEQGLMRQLVLNPDNVQIELYGLVAQDLRTRSLLVVDETAESGWRLFSSAFASWVEEQQLDDWYDKGIAHLEAGNLERAREHLERIRSRRSGYRDVTVRLRNLMQRLRRERYPPLREAVWALLQNKTYGAFAIATVAAILLLVVLNVFTFLSWTAEETFVESISPFCTPTSISSPIPIPRTKDRPEQGLTVTPEITAVHEQTATEESAAIDVVPPDIRIEPPAPEYIAKCGNGQVYRFGAGIYNDSAYAAHGLWLNLQLLGDTDSVASATYSLITLSERESRAYMITETDKGDWIALPEIPSKDSHYVSFEIRVDGDERKTIALVAGVAWDQPEQHAIRRQTAFYLFHCLPVGVTPTVPKPTVTATPTLSPTVTNTVTSTIAPPKQPEPTSKWTPTRTPIPTHTPTPTDTPTHTPTPTDTPTHTPTPTNTPTHTPTPCPLTVGVSIGTPWCNSQGEAFVHVTLSPACGYPPYTCTPGQSFYYQYEKPGRIERIQVSVSSQDGQLWSESIKLPKITCP